MTSRPLLEGACLLEGVWMLWSLLEQLVQRSILSAMQAPSDAPQASVGPAHQTGVPPATQAFVMNDRAEQRFRQLEMKVRRYALKQ